MVMPMEEGRRGEGGDFSGKGERIDGRPATLYMSLDDAIRNSRQKAPPPAHRRMVTVLSPTTRHGRRQGHSSSSLLERHVRGRRGEERRGPSTLDNPAAKITISNLHHQVTRQDLHELFSTVAPVRRVYMHYDRSGRSTGVANVLFNSRLDASLAADRYQHVPLDGHPMQIELASTTNRHRRAGPVGDGNLYQRPSPTTPSQNNPWPHDRTPIDAASLDADLDAYMMHN